LIVSQTFAKDVEQWKKDVQGTACFVDEAQKLIKQEKEQQKQKPTRVEI
jgi:hypothetical protein